MTYQNSYTVSALLKKIRTCLEYSSDQEYEKLTYAQFKAIMMLREDVEPVMCYERTIKEKYRLLQDFNFVSKSGILNITLLNQYLEESA